MGDDEEKETARSIAKAQGLQFHCIPTERCGALNVYIQGDLESIQRSFNPIGNIWFAMSLIVIMNLY